MKTINEIKALVGENRVEDALNALIEYVAEKDDTLTNQLFLTKGRYKEYVVSTNLGLEERNHERQQIINSILLIADDAEQFVKIVETTATTISTMAQEVSIKGNDEIIGLLFTHIYAYNTNDFKAMQLTLHPDYAEVKPAEWKEFLKKNVGENIVFQIIKIEPVKEEPTKATYKMDFIRKSTLTPPAIDPEWTSDIFTLMLDDKKRWKIVNDENIEFKIIKIA